MNKKIKIEIAVGIIVVVAILIGSSFWMMQGEKGVSVKQLSQIKTPGQSVKDNQRDAIVPVSGEINTDGCIKKFCTSPTGDISDICETDMCPYPNSTDARGKLCEKMKAGKYFPATPNFGKTKEYKSAKYDFSISYPSNWFVNVGETEIKNGFITFSNDNNCKPKLDKCRTDHMAYFVQVYEKNNESSSSKLNDYKEWSKKYNHFDKSYDIETKSGQKITVNEESVCMWDRNIDLIDRFLPDASVLVENDRYVFQFSIATETGNEQATLEYLKKSLETFKFIK